MGGHAVAHKLVGALTVLPLLIAAQPGAAAGPGDTAAALARDLGRLESVRAVKNIQRLYAQYEQAGRWSELGDLFADKGRLAWGDQTIEGVRPSRLSSPSAAAGRWTRA